MQTRKMGTKEVDIQVSLVLTIFKGENFVCKSPGVRCQIEAKCCDQVLRSGVISISTTNADPFFNFQLAWQFTRKQLRDLRGNKVPVKVRCLIVDDHDERKHSELGYVILHVKDAFPWSGGEVEVSKAKSLPLLGTTQPWKSYDPRLVVQLHIEDYNANKIATHDAHSRAIDQVDHQRRQYQQQQGNNKELKPSTTERLEAIDSADKSPRISFSDIVLSGAKSADKFGWRIDESEGYFQLGESMESDDLFLLSITLVSTSNFHSLWNGRSPKVPGDGYVWQIKYRAYGCDIKSDPFLLNTREDDRTTFLGDKAAARIRAYSPLFCEYLEEVVIEFNVFRFQISDQNELVKEEFMGIGFGQLQDLADSEITQLKATVSVVSEWGGFPSLIPSSTGNPEIRILFQLNALPGFFSKPAHERQLLLQELNKGLSSSSPKNIESSFIDDHAAVSSPHAPMIDKMTHDDTVDEILKEIRQIPEHADNHQSSEAAKDMTEVQSLKEPKKTDHEEKICSGKNQYSETLVLEFLNEKYTSDAQNKLPELAQRSSSDSSSSASDSDTVSPMRPSLPGRNEGKTQSEGDPSDEAESSSHQKIPELPLDVVSSCSSESSKENSNMVLPDPGLYKIVISLRRFWMKSHSPLIHDVVLSYVHPKFRITDSVICTATPSSGVVRGKPIYRCLEIQDGVNAFESLFERFPEKLINEPMTVEFRIQSETMLEPMFAFSMVPVGNVLLQSEKQGMRKLTGQVDVLKTGSNVRIGILKFEVCFQSLAVGKPKDNRLQTSNKLNISPVKGEQHVPNLENYDASPKRIEDFRLWELQKKGEFQEELKKKERAYLKILAEEAASRDEQREKLLSEKMKELKKKEKEVALQAGEISQREKDIQRRQIELEDLNRKSNLDSTSVLENAKLHVKRMQEEHKIEVSSLRKQNQEYESELKRLKGKLDIFERKLEEKEEFIGKLKSEKYSRPDAIALEKLKLLEQENLMLKKQIIDIEKSREKYKKQSQALCMKLADLQDERDKQLKDENENLRLQILASKQHKELKKERKAVVGLSEKVRCLQTDSSKGAVSDSGLPSGKSVQGKASPALERDIPSGEPAVLTASNAEAEIQRLTKMRSGLLNTGAYTKFDMVIKEMEKRIVGLVEGKLSK